MMIYSPVSNQGDLFKEHVFSWFLNIVTHLTIVEGVLGSYFMVVKR